MKTTANLINQELTTFASQFSEEYKSLPDGDYFSDGDMYHIKYANFFEGMGSETNQIAISHKTKIIYVNRKNIIDSHKDYVYFLIIWSIVQEKIVDHLASDQLVIQHYIKSNRSAISLLQSFDFVCLYAPSDLNDLRLKQMTELLLPIKEEA